MIRWGIIGLGNIAKRFAKSLQFDKGAKLFAVASRTEEKIKYYEDTYNGVKVFNSYEDLIKDDDIDAVYIALPHKLHMEYTIKALNAKKAVLCEKPSCMNSKELEKVIKCAKVNKRFYMEAVKTPFIPIIEVIKKVLQDNVIGNINSIYASFCSNFPENNKSYIYDNEQGGAILDLATYPISFVFEIMEKRKILSINTEKKYKEIGNNKINVHFNTVLEFEGDIKAYLEGGIDGEKERLAIIEGSKGTMYVPMFNRPESYKIVLSNGKEYEEKLSIKNDDMFGEIEEANRCIKDKKIESSKQSFEKSRDILEIIEQMIN